MTTPRNFTFIVRIRKISSNDQGKDVQGQPPTFKVDGQRFQASNRTIKFHCGAKYHVHINVNPPVQLDWLRIAGSDSPLHVSSSTGGSTSPTTLGKGSHGSSGKAASQYWAEWDTAGLSPTQSGKREAINFSLQGPGISLSKSLQCKFYGANDSHAAWGNALEALVFKCTTDSQGILVVTEEEFK